MKWEAYDSDLPLDSSVVVGGVVYRLENFIQSGFGGSPGGHGCMERVKRDRGGARLSWLRDFRIHFTESRSVVLNRNLKNVRDVPRFDLQLFSRLV